MALTRIKLLRLKSHESWQSSTGDTRRETGNNFETWNWTRFVSVTSCHALFPVSIISGFRSVLYREPSKVLLVNIGEFELTAIWIWLAIEFELTSNWIWADWQLNLSWLASFGVPNNVVKVIPEDVNWKTAKNIQ